MSKRRKFTSTFKAQIVISILSGEKTPGELCRAHNLHPNVVARWKIEFVENAASVFDKGNINDDQGNRIAELERMVGRLTMENEVLKKTSGLLILNEKNSGRSS